MAYQHAELTEAIIDAVIRVHSRLGPGFLESIYRNALTIELSQRKIYFEAEKEYPVMYEGRLVGKHRLDLLVEDTVIVELKTVEEFHKAHYAQLRSYLKAAKKEVGLLVNFAKMRADFRRVELDSSPASPYLLIKKRHRVNCAI
ncbi:GxxExxY protein [Candidatus Sumerlaeota bacterium]|nr:GxxExxY protein [Candidatus Sumerlaeota bacterium]